MVEPEEQKHPEKPGFEECIFPTHEEVTDERILENKVIRLKVAKGHLESIIAKCEAGGDLSLQEIRDIYMAGEGGRLLKDIRNDRRLNDTAWKVMANETLKEVEYLDLKKVGDGGQAGVRLIEVLTHIKYVLKIYEYKVKDVHYDPVTGWLITSTGIQGHLNDQSEQ